MIFPNGYDEFNVKIDKNDNCRVLNLLNSKKIRVNSDTLLLDKIILPSFKSENEVEIVFDKKININTIEILLDNKIDELVRDKYFRLFIPKCYSLTGIEKLRNYGYKIELCYVKDSAKKFYLTINSNEEIVCSDDLVDINTFKDKNYANSQITKLCNELNINFKNLDDIRKLIRLIDFVANDDISYLANNIDNSNNKKLTKNFTNNNNK